MRSRHLAVSAVLCGVVAGMFAGTSTANADPLVPCQRDGYGRCSVQPSGPINGYNPYDPSGEGFLRGYGPDSSWIGEGTITNPGGIVATSVPQLQQMICSDLSANGVTVDNVERIFHVLYEAPYNYTPHDAGQSVALAVQDVCPHYKSALMAASGQSGP